MAGTSFQAVHAAIADPLAIALSNVVAAAVTGRAALSGMLPTEAQSLSASGVGWNGGFVDTPAR